MCLNDSDIQQINANIEIAKRKYSNISYIPDCITEFEYYCKFYDTVLNDDCMRVSKCILEDIADNRTYGVGLYNMFEPMTDCLKLASKNVSIGLFSNTYPSVVRFLKDKNVLDIFSNNCFSYQEGLKKPNCKIFEHMLHKTALKPSEILLIDDSEACINVAEMMGMNTVQVDKTNLDESIRRIGEWL